MHRNDGRASSSSAISEPSSDPTSGRFTRSSGDRTGQLLHDRVRQPDHLHWITADRSGHGLTASGLAWVQNGYTLVFGGLLPLAAHAGDLPSRRRMFVIGLVIFGVASFLIKIAQNEAWIIAARALQGVGAAIVAPPSLALITGLFPAGKERTRAVAAYGTTAGLGARLVLVVGRSAHRVDLLAGRVFHQSSHRVPGDRKHPTVPASGSPNSPPNSDS